MAGRYRRFGGSASRGGLIGDMIAFRPSERWSDEPFGDGVITRHAQYRTTGFPLKHSLG
jgi:hypothetical protein